MNAVYTGKQRVPLHEPGLCSYGLPGDNGWYRWIDTAESTGLLHRPNPVNRGFIASLGGPLRLEAVHGRVGGGNVNVKMPGDQGWEPWVKLRCAAPRRHFARKLPPLPVTRTTFRLDTNLVR